MLSSAPLPICVWRGDSFVFQNDACRKLFGYSDDDLRKTPPTEIVPRWARESIVKFLQPFLGTQSLPPVHDVPAETRDGRLIYVDVHLTCRPDGQVIGILVDTSHRRARSAFEEIGAKATVPAVGLSRLTVREREIAGMIAARMTNKQIATRLNLTEGTVKVHVHHMFKTLGIKSRRDIAGLAEAEAQAVPEMEPSGEE